MSEHFTDQAHPIVVETPDKKPFVSHVRPIRRPLARRLGVAAATGVLATAIIAANQGQGQNQEQTSEDISFKPIPGVIVEGETPKPPELEVTVSKDKELPLETLSPEETARDNVTIRELFPNTPNLAIEKLNGLVSVKINTQNDTPKFRESPSTLENRTGEGILPWEQVGEINGIRINKAVESQGEIEITLKNPLITRGLNPDTGGNDGIWITVVREGKPYFISASQQTAGLVTLRPNPDVNQSMFEPVLPNEKALDYGKVSLRPALESVVINNPQE